VAAAAVLVLLGGGLLLRKGGSQVILDTVPANATVLKDGKELGKTPLSLLLHAGDRLRLERKGYQPRDYQFAAGDAAPKLALESVKSEETLRTDPAGATVVLDGETLPQVTPVTVKNWDQGAKHALNFKRGTQVANFDLMEGETPGSQVYKLDAAGAARLTAVPEAVDVHAPGAIKFNGEYPVHVRLDGKDSGELRAGGTLAAAPGPHTLELSSPAVFFKESRPVTVKPGQTLALALPGLVRLTVSTYPSDDKVVVDGHVTGVDSDGSAPVTLTRGRHRITIQGHPGVVKEVDLQSDVKLPAFKI
jgi:hypothetical protein